MDQPLRCWWQSSSVSGTRVPGLRSISIEKVGQARGTITSSVLLARQQYLAWWLGSVTECWTCDRKVVGSTPGRVAIEWLLLGWVTVYGQVNLSVYNQPRRSTQPSIPLR